MKEKSMTIPPLKTINKLVLRSHEIFIAAGGFEDRIFKFSQIVTPDKAKGNKAVLLDYRPSESKNKLGDLKEILTKKGLDVDIIVYDRYEPEDFGGRFKDILLRNNINSLCLDISGMSKLAIMIIMDVVRELNLSLRIVYAEALEYAPSKSDFEKAKAECSQHLPTSFIHTGGVYDVLNVTRFSSIRMQCHATLLVAFDSFNEALCQVLVNSINPSKLILVNGRPPRKELEWREEATEYVHHCLREEWSVGDDNKSIQATSTLYYSETYELLSNLYWEFSGSHRIILSPTGSKMQTVGCYLLRAIHNDVHVVYPTVQGFFADKYSTGVREHWEIDFGRLDKLIDKFRKNELSEHLGLPADVVDADIE